MICPACNGEREVILGGTNIWCAVPCPACDGTGVVDDRYPEWHERGAAVKAARMAPYTRLSEAARMCGVDVCEYSAMEHGWADPTRIEPLIVMQEARRTHL